MIIFGIWKLKPNMKTAMQRIMLIFYLYIIMLLIIFAMKNKDAEIDFNSVSVEIAKVGVEDAIDGGA